LPLQQHRSDAKTSCEPKLQNARDCEFIFVRSFKASQFCWLTQPVLAFKSLRWLHLQIL
jgi:hypothetical protein